MTFTGHFNRVIVDDKAYPLSPGAQIRDIHNRLVLPSHIRGKYKVRVKLNQQGFLHRIWLLTPEETRAPDPDDKPKDETPEDDSSEEDEDVEEKLRALGIRS